LGSALEANFSKFETQTFAQEMALGVKDLELKDRVLFMANGLKRHLPDDYEKSAQIIFASLGEPLDGETGMFTEGYWLMPLARFVEEHGLDHFNLSMQLCEEITKRHTSEYAVRPYIESDPHRALKIMTDWTMSPDLHIRRLASEGVRPRLPWAKRLDVFVQQPQPILELIEPLRADPSRYVRMSVANLINDVSKDHPHLVEQLAKRWSKDENKLTNWIINHGTRTLRKGS